MDFWGLLPDWLCRLLLSVVQMEAELRLACQSNFPVSTDAILIR